MGNFFSISTPSNEKESEKNSSGEEITFSIVTCASFLPSSYNIKDREKQILDFFVDQKLLPRNFKESDPSFHWSKSCELANSMSASKQVFSFQIKAKSKPDVSKLAAKMNKKLESKYGIHVWTVLSIPKPFLSSKHCDERTFGYVIPDETKNFSIHARFQNIIGAVEPYIHESKELSLTLNISEVFNKEKLPFFIVYVCGRKANNSTVLRFISLLVSVSKGFKTTSDLIQMISRGELEQTLLPPLEGLFFESGNYARFTMRARRGILPPEKDVEFTSFTPEIEKWKIEVLYPKIVDSMKEKIDDFILRLGAESI